MHESLNRRAFLKGSLTAGALAGVAAEGLGKAETPGQEKVPELPKGKIKGLPVSRMLLGGNLLTHYTHSRDLRYVYKLAKHYNTPEKIKETLALAEASGVDTLSVHNPPQIVRILKEYRGKDGGKIKWIICPTAIVRPGLKAYREAVKKLVDDGADAIYLWGVRADQLVRDKKPELIGQAVEVAKEMGVPSGVGGHDLNVIRICEKEKVPADFYIKTFHHHRYPTGPKPAEIKGPYQEIPGYWCANPDETINVMKDVKKPWIAFKVMAAGAIPPKDAFPYVFQNGADHVLVGMFDFEIQGDVQLVCDALKKAKERKRAWFS